jgi:hypothetical protein
MGVFRDRSVVSMAIESLACGLGRICRWCVQMRVLRDYLGRWSGVKVPNWANNWVWWWFIPDRALTPAQELTVPDTGATLATAQRYEKNYFSRGPVVGRRAHPKRYAPKGAQLVKKTAPHSSATATDSSADPVLSEPKRLAIQYTSQPHQWFQVSWSSLSGNGR